jgi:hypothetical protein
LAQRGDWYNDEGGYEFAGEGTKEDPYLIASVEGLTYLAEQVNIWPGKSFQGEHFRMTADIDLGKHYWIPVGSEAHQSFRGVFDGNGKRILNLYIGSEDVDNVYSAAGLFGHVGNGARIENLTIAGGRVIGGGRESVSRTGSIAGYILCSVSGSEDSIVVRNCHTEDMKITGADTEISNTGGLIGECYSLSDGSGQASVVIENCSYGGAVYGRASGFPYTGGIAGKGAGHGYCNGEGRSTGLLILRSCLNRGEIRGGAAMGKEAITSTGGILGFGYGSGDGGGVSEGAGSVVIERCMNAGSVSGGEAVGAQAFSYAGGLAGYGDGYGYSGSTSTAGGGGNYGYGAFVIRTSANRGNVDSGNAVDSTSVTSTGGLLGYGSSSAASGIEGQEAAYGILSVRDSYSNAAIRARRGYIGGLAGWVATVGQGAVSAVIRDSYASGSINKGDTVYPVTTGGIAGNMQRTKEAVRAPQIGNCLVALTYMDGRLGRTFRIAGQVQGVRQPLSSILGKNYAYVGDGEWMKSATLKNGLNWSRQTHRPPVSLWNERANVWEIKEGSRRYMPLLEQVGGQEEVAIP